MPVCKGRAEGWSEQLQHTAYNQATSQAEV